MKSYIIKKGKHYSWHFPRLWFGKKNVLNFNFCMSQSCWFPMQDSDDYAINKLTGWSYGLHHKNSIRVGWRPSDRNNWIELHLYIYANGIRSDYYMDIVECGIKNIVELTYYSKKGRIVYSIHRPIAICNGVISVRPEKTWWGYYLFPYFGGIKTAAVDTRIDLSFE